jgi:hypothetical protein
MRKAQPFPPINNIKETNKIGERAAVAVANQIFTKKKSSLKFLNLVS